MTRDDDMHAFRAQELLLKRATEGLDDAEAAELAALGADQDISFDLAAASIDIATLRSVEQMPAGVADKILVAVSGNSDFPTVNPVRQSQPAIPTTLAGVVPARPLGRSQPQPEPQPVASIGSAEARSDANAARSPIDELAAARVKKSRAPMIAAYLAAAAAIVLAVGAVLWARGQEPKVIDRVVMPATPSPSEARAELLASAKDVITLPWTATDDTAAKGTTGDIVWSPSQQKGYMRFVGLAVNDPNVLQYQLWIFDETRDQAFPVDGGVFDVATGEVIVPIAAKLPVGKPALFAVTVEKPGGVVVSKRERIVVTAKPS